jgi:hypothetical protein
MNRRDVIAGLGSAAAWRAQQAVVPVVGFFDSGSANVELCNRCGRTL